MPCRRAGETKVWRRISFSPAFLVNQALPHARHLLSRPFFFVFSPDVHSALIDCKSVYNTCTHGSASIRQSAFPKSPAPQPYLVPWRNLIHATHNSSSPQSPRPGKSSVLQQFTFPHTRPLLDVSQGVDVGLGGAWITLGCYTLPYLRCYYPWISTLFFPVTPGGVRGVRCSIAVAQIRRREERAPPRAR